MCERSLCATAVLFQNHWDAINVAHLNGLRTWSCVGCVTLNSVACTFSTWVRHALKIGFKRSTCEVCTSESLVSLMPHSRTPIKAAHISAWGSQMCAWPAVPRSGPYLPSRVPSSLTDILDRRYQSDRGDSGSEPHLQGKKPHPSNKGLRTCS
jgi:hypothetical protein